MATISYENWLPVNGTGKFGFNLSKASATTLTMTPGTTYDSTNSVIINNIFTEGTPANLTISTAANGANALDTGTIADSKVYAVYAICDVSNNNPVAGLLSLSATAPTMPPGYSNFKRIGWWTTDGSANLLVIYQSGTSYTYDVPVTIITTGTATTQTALPVNAGVPALSNIVAFYQCDFTPGAASRVLQLFPSGSTSTTTQKIVGQATSVHVQQTLAVPTVLISGVPNVDYLVSNSGDNAAIYVYGFVDYFG